MTMTETTADATEATGRPSLLTIWGLVGTVLLLGKSVVRLSFVAWAGLTHPSVGPLHLAIAVAWSAFMAWSEGYRGFYMGYSRRVVTRAFAMPGRVRHPLLMLLAPFVSMGLIYSTRRRYIVSWSVVLGVIGIVVLVRQLSQPWRGLIDLGVVVGLAMGLVSILIHTRTRLMGGDLGVPVEFHGDPPLRRR